MTLQVPPAWFDDAPDLRRILPTGRVSTLTELWLCGMKKHAYQLVVEGLAPDAFSALSMVVKELTGKRPQWMKEQRKLTFHLGEWFFMAFGGDGEPSLQLILSKSCDEPVFRAGAARLLAEMEPAGKLAATSAFNASRSIQADGTSAGWAIIKSAISLKY